MNINLEKLKPGEKGNVVSISDDSKIRKKLAEMGIVKGIELELIRVAPLGDPIEVNIRGYQLSLRKSEAQNIILEKA